MPTMCNFRCAFDPAKDDPAVSRSALLRSIARRRSAASTRTVIGSRQLVAGRLDPPLGVRIWASACAGGGFYFHEAAGCRSLRRFERISAGGGGLVCRRWSSAFPRSRSARAWWCAPAGGGGLWDMSPRRAATRRLAAQRTAARRVAARRNSTQRFFTPPPLNER